MPLLSPLSRLSNRLPNPSVTEEEETGRIGAAFGPNYARLIEMKQKYDPGNLFRLNQNIKPAA